MTGQCDQGRAFADLVDYWTGDLTAEDADRIEAHLFECAECANYLEDVLGIGRAIHLGMRGGQVQTIVTESMLNALSRDGLRMRT